MPLTNVIILYAVFIGGLVIAFCLAVSSRPRIPLPAFTAVLVIVAIVILFVGIWLVGLVFLRYTLATSVAFLGPVLLFMGLRRLFIRLDKRIRYRSETQGHIVYYIRSPWNDKIKRSHADLRFYTPWFPVVEYEAGGKWFRQKSEIAVLCDARNKQPPETTMLIRYDPKHPERFYIPEYALEFSFTNWFVSVLFLFVGACLVYASVLGVAVWIAAG